MRNKFFWLLATIIMCGAMLTGLTSCSNSDNISIDDKNKVAVLLPDGNYIDRWISDKANLKEALNAYGIKAAFYVAPETPEGAMLQVEQLKQAIDDGVKYIVLTYVDYEKINESGVLEQHPDVKVICHDRLFLDNPSVVYISTADTKEVGRLQGQFLLNHFESSGAASMTMEILEGPLTDVNSINFYDGAMEILKNNIDNGKLIVKSGKTEYSDVMVDSWTVADGKKAMIDRLSSYEEGQRPDMILAAIDNQAQAVIEVLEEAGITDMPVITGQDNSAISQAYIKSGKQAMTIDKNLKDMANNTAMILNSLISNTPIPSGQSISNIPVIYSKLTVITKDSY